MVPSRRWKSSVSAYWSSGNAPGSSEVSVNIAARSPRSSSTPTRRAGSTTARSISSAVRGTTASIDERMRSAKPGYESGRSKKSARSVVTTRTRACGSATSARIPARNLARRASSSPSVKTSSSWSTNTTISSLPGGRIRLIARSMPSSSRSSTSRRPHRGVAGDPQQGRLKLDHRVRAGQHLHDRPAFRAAEGAGAQRGDESGPDHRRLPAPTRADDGQEAIRGEPGDQLLGERFPAEEHSGVGLFEGKKPLVRVRRPPDRPRGPSAAERRDQAPAGTLGRARDPSPRAGARSRRQARSDP